MAIAILLSSVFLVTKIADLPPPALADFSPQRRAECFAVFAAFKRVFSAVFTELFLNVCK
ncbi:hypothetical protein [Marinobacterium jannaschii]|uniref:hypothetical protein n=1 Tax=Marinobacterium jannaschii TaxID=64970 RepID=UPI0012EB2A54|nr:hypothetical protein [Marinobacterium jannaschii]